jgi:hypothetical protein
MAIDRLTGTLGRVKHGTTAGLSCLYTTRPTYSTPEASADIGRCPLTIREGPPIGAGSANGSSTERGGFEFDLFD